MSIAVIGAGKWGQALFSALSIKNSCVITSRTKRDLPNFVDLKTALDCDLLIFTIATQSVNLWLKENFVYKNQKILVASKGIEASSGKFLDEIFENYTQRSNLAYLSGPSFAAEVVKNLPCAVVVNSHNINLSNFICGLFPDFIKAYSSDDVKGAEICGAYKNVLAIACGISDGLNLGNNARASLMARGLVEMQRFGEFFGAKNDTFLGLSGAGDLFLTASSVLSRNYRVGLGIAKGKKLNLILEELGEVAEGVLTSKAIVKIATKNKIYTPIATQVELLLNGKDPKISMKDLLKKV